MVQSAPMTIHEDLGQATAGEFRRVGGINTVNLTPSNRTSPLNVPNQRYPLGVWAIEVAEF